MQFHFYTVMAFDAHQNGVPVAWVISSSAMEIEVRKWLGAMRDRMLQLNPAWRPASWLMTPVQRLQLFGDISHILVFFGGTCISMFRSHFAPKAGFHD